MQGIARITLNRPPANVLSIETMEDVNRALESLEYQREVKLVVIRGDGQVLLGRASSWATTSATAPT